MGATWFGPAHKNLIALLQAQGIEYFEQYMAGTAFFEPFSMAAPQAIQLPTQEASYRIKGGSMALIQSLANRLTAEELLLNQPVRSLYFERTGVQVNTENGQWNCKRIISTLPPALLAASVFFSPALPEPVKEIALHTHTWMQDSIKIAFTYQEPFWRNQGMAGTIFSNVGPVTELYDHSDSGEPRYALCGFVSGSLLGLSALDRRDKILQQLERLLGSAILNYTHFEEKIWANEPFTKQKDPLAIYPHQNNGHAVYSASLFNNRFFFCGSETASAYPGYMEGAVQAALELATVLT